MACSFLVKLSFPIWYRSVPMVFPITAPRTGTGMSICPASEETALTAASIHRASECSMNSCSPMAPVLYKWACSATPKEAVVTALATAAGVAVKFVST